MLASATSSVAELKTVLAKLPLAYAKTNALFRTREKKNAGSGGLFGIFVNDLCKGCGECVVECGDHEALVMVDETEEINGLHETGSAFYDVLPDTDVSFLGAYDPSKPAEAKAAILHNHLMQKDDYFALVSGDGACAGCGEKTVLRAVASLTEAYMRPLYHAKAARLDALADRLASDGAKLMGELQKSQPERYGWLRKAVLGVVMGYGGGAATLRRLPQLAGVGNATSPRRGSLRWSTTIAPLANPASNNRGWRAFGGNYHLYPNQMWKNDGDGTFSDVAEEIGVRCGDATDVDTILAGQPEGGLGVLEERVLLVVQVVAPVHQQRRHPMIAGVMIAVDVPRHANETLHQLAVAQRYVDELEVGLGWVRLAHSAGSMWRAGRRFKLVFVS